MTPFDAHDHALQTLRELRPLAPHGARAARVRARCRTQLARIQQGSEHTTPTNGFGRRILGPAVVLGLCALYVTSVLRAALQLRGGL